MKAGLKPLILFNCSGTDASNFNVKFAQKFALKLSFLATKTCAKLFKDGWAFNPCSLNKSPLYLSLFAIVLSFRGKLMIPQSY
jgi:hypothetical protein